MKEGLIKLEDKPQKMFYEPKQKVNNWQTCQRNGSVVMND